MSTLASTVYTDDEARRMIRGIWRARKRSGGAMPTTDEILGVLPIGTERLGRIIGQMKAAGELSDLASCRDGRASKLTDEDIRRRLKALWCEHARWDGLRPKWREIREVLPVDQKRIRRIIGEMEASGELSGLVMAGRQLGPLGEGRGDDGAKPAPKKDPALRAREAASAKGDAYDWLAWRREHLRRERGIRECVPRLRAEIGRREAEASSGG